MLTQRERALVAYGALMTKAAGDGRRTTSAVLEAIPLAADRKEARDVAYKVLLMSPIPSARKWRELVASPAILVPVAAVLMASSIRPLVAEPKYKSIHKQKGLS